MVVNHKEVREDDDGDSSSSESSIEGEQVRISLNLAADCVDRSLEVPSEPIAVPASVSRKQLSAVLNHLLDRRLDDGDDDEEKDGDDDDDDDRLPPMRFDFILGKNNKLLRTGVEREARRSGLSLEEAIPITYFPSQEEPQSQGESDELPDWISAMSFVSCKSSHKKSVLCAACYDGSMYFFQTNGPSVAMDDRENAPIASGTSTLEKICTLGGAHQGPIKCLSAEYDEPADKILVASGSMDNTLALHQLNVNTSEVSLYANCTNGHASAIGAVDMIMSSSSNKLLVSGEWDGGICVWDLSETPEVLQPEEDPQQSNKRTKRAAGSSSAPATTQADSKMSATLSPKISILAHTSKVSGVSWGNYEKIHSGKGPVETVITGSWDHSLKLWNVERHDCLLTLNGSRVVSCLDTSYHSKGIVATGHPDCTIRLWDVRCGGKESTASSLANDTTFRPSHSEWISEVNWSKQSPYHLASTSHDGRIKLWDIRSSLPLYTVRAFTNKKKDDKTLCLAYGNDILAAGGTDCIIKLFHQPKTGALSDVESSSMLNP